MQVLPLLVTFMEEEDTLRNSSQKNLNAKAKKIWVEKSKVTNLKDPRRYGYLNQLELCVVGFKEGKVVLE